MEDQDRNARRQARRAGRPLGGLVLIGIGSLLLAREMGLGVPHWVLSWPMIPIAVGLYIGARNSFTAGGWMIPIAVGLFFLINREFLDMELRQYTLPIIIIAVGLMMIFRPGFRRNRFNNDQAVVTDEKGEQLDSFALFGGTKSNVITKDLKGGKVEAFFGGVDLNLTQADFQGTIVINFNVAFGGVKMVVPPQWNIQNEISSVLSGVDDKRPLVSQTDSGKLLILKGSVFFGGIEIKSY